MLYRLERSVLLICQKGAIQVFDLLVPHSNDCKVHHDRGGQRRQGRQASKSRRSCSWPCAADALARPRPAATSSALRCLPTLTALTASVMMDLAIVAVWRKQIKYSKCVVLIPQLNSALDPISSGRQLLYHSIFMRTETRRRGVPRKEPFKNERIRPFMVACPE